MADELPVDEAAFHAAIMAINNAIDGGETKATLRGKLVFVFIALYIFFCYYHYSNLCFGASLKSIIELLSKKGFIFFNLFNSCTKTPNNLPNIPPKITLNQPH